MKGIIMSENAAPKRIDQLLAEADALIQQVGGDAVKIRENINGIYWK
jgi:hypothetical protein